MHFFVLIVLQGVLQMKYREKSLELHVTEERLESTETGALPCAADQSVGEFSAGYSCQSDICYGSNLTPLCLAALVIVHIPLVLPS